MLTHGEKDAHDAIRRATSTYTPRWHPILDTTETEPGTWQLVGQYGQIHGVVIMLEIGGERGYRGTTWSDDPERRELVGYYRTLLAAVKAVHMRWVGSRGQTGAANGR